MSKQQKIEQLMALISGKLSRADISPRLVIHFNEQDGNTYMINSRIVDSDKFHNLLRTLPAIGTLVTHGRENDNEEYYYD